MTLQLTNTKIKANLTKGSGKIDHTGVRPTKPQNRW